MTPLRRIIVVYYTVTGLYTLATSMVWGINTLFLMNTGLNILQVMLVNAAFTAGMVLFEIPTGVVADTVGRKASFLLCLVILFVTTLLYLAVATFGWGFWAFFGVSVFIGLGFTFFTGAVEAWLVDALHFTGYDGPPERIFARGQAVFAATMLIGTVGGGFLGQVHLWLPYVLRAALIVPTFVVAVLFIQDVGFEPSPFDLSTIRPEVRRIFLDGVKYGWKHPVLRLCMLGSFVEGVFFIFGWYSWQRYFLDLLQQELVWVAGIVAALLSLSMILGNALVDRVSERGIPRPTILAFNAVIRSAAVFGAGLIGVLVPVDKRGLIPFMAAVFLYLVFGVSFGLSKPVRMAFVNSYVPTGRRATVLSVDSLFEESGAVVGQTGLGSLSKALSIGAAWVVGGAVLLLGFPLYRKARLVADSLDEKRGPIPGPPAPGI